MDIKKSIKKLLLLLLCVPLMGFSQIYKTIKDYSYKTYYDGSTDSVDNVLLTTKFYFRDSILKSEFYMTSNIDDVDYWDGYPPFVILSFEEINNLREFFERSKIRFYELDSIRVANGIKEMNEKIDDFPVKGILGGYGRKTGSSSLETYYISWKSGRSVMQLRAEPSLLIQYVLTNYDQRVNETFQFFLDDLNIEFYQQEKESIEKANQEKEKELERLRLEWEEYIKAEKDAQVVQIPTSFSLEKYTPHAIHQEGPYCLSIAYSNIMTILYAHLYDLEDIDEITERRFEPYFIKYLFTTSSSDSILSYNRTEDISSFLTHFGLPFDKDFDGTVDNRNHLLAIMKKASKYTLGFCDYCPIHSDESKLCFPLPLIQEADMRPKFWKARLSRFLGGERCHTHDFAAGVNNLTFEFNEDNETIVYYQDSSYIQHEKIKRSIYEGKPCILNISRYNSALFYNSYKDFGYSILKNDSTESGGHAMVIIGYDDELFGGAYRVLNSWGEDWADNGKTWIRYRDLDGDIDGGMFSSKRPPVVIAYQFDNVRCQKDIENRFPKQELEEIEIQKFIVDLPNLIYKE